MMTHETHPNSGRTVVHIAGACMGYHTGPGGWAWVVLGERTDASSAPIEQVASGGVPDTDINCMELMAVREAITSLDGELVIKTNNRYVSDSLDQMRQVNCENKTWLKKNKKFAKHQDLWKPIIKAYQENRIALDWVKDNPKDSGIDEAAKRAEQAANEAAAKTRKVVYIAGLKKKHPGNPGGWAWVVPDGQSDSGGVPETTSDRLELLAVRKVINSLDGKLLIKTGNRHLLELPEQMRRAGENNNSWIELNEELAKHQDLIKLIIKAYRKGRIIFSWEKRDSSDRDYKSAVKLASQAANEITASSRTVVYTDGSCRIFPNGSNKKGFGGWAWLVLGGRFASGGALHTSSDCMELRAVLEAINSLDGKLLIITDYTHLSDRFEEEQPFCWKMNDWLNSDMEPVEHQELWEQIIEAYQAGKVVFDKVKGHSGDPGNDAADKLARRESKEIAKAR